MDSEHTTCKICGAGPPVSNRFGMHASCSRRLDWARRTAKHEDIEAILNDDGADCITGNPESYTPEQATIKAAEIAVRPFPGKAREKRGWKYRRKTE